MIYVLILDDEDDLPKFIADLVELNLQCELQSSFEGNRLKVTVEPTILSSKAFGQALAGPLLKKGWFEKFEIKDKLTLH